MPRREILTESWKQKLVRFAHNSQADQLPFRTRLVSSKTVLGQKFVLRDTMSHNLEWTSKIKGDVRFDEPMSKHTSIRIGGPADIFIFPKDTEDLKTIFKYRGNLPLFVMGEGTNLIAADQGFRGIVGCL